MDTKREIHGIDQAVCLLMFALDRLFAHRVEGWRRSRKGFVVNVVREQRGGNDIALRIRPVGLPEEDYVICRFDRTSQNSHWNPYKGQISYNHSAVEIRNFAFDGTMAAMADFENLIKPRTHEALFKEIIARGLIYPSKDA